MTELSPEDTAIVNRAAARVKRMTLARLTQQLPKGYTIVETYSTPDWMEQFGTAGTQSGCCFRKAYLESHTCGKR
jgi:hypothetical protein